MSNIFKPTPVTTTREVFTFTDDMVELVDGFANSPFPTLSEDIIEEFNDIGCDVLVFKDGTKIVDGMESLTYCLTVFDKYNDLEGRNPIYVRNGESLALGGRGTVEKITL